MHLALGGTIAPSPALGQVPLAVCNLFAVLLVGGPLGEEFGWRGFALPSLQARMGWRLHRRSASQASALNSPPAPPACGLLPSTPHR